MGKLTVTEENAKPQTPSPGNRSLYPKADGWYELNDQGTERLVFALPVFGQNFNEAHNDVQATSTDGNNYQTHTSLTTGSLDAGIKIRIGITMAWNMSTAGRNFEAELTIGGAVANTMAMETKDTGADIRNWVTSFFYMTVPSTGPLVMELNYGPQNNGDTATIFYSGIECWRVE